MFHRSVLAGCGAFDEAVGFNEDYEFLLRCCILHGRTMHYVPRVVADWRTHSGQLTAAHGDAEQRAKNDHIRSLVLSRLPAGERAEYAAALLEYQRPPPFHVRARRRIRDAALGALSEPNAKRAAGLWLRLSGRRGRAGGTGTARPSARDAGGP